MTCSVDTVAGGGHRLKRKGSAKRTRTQDLKEEAATLKENCRKQMNHIHMLETRLKQITKRKLNWLSKRHND